MQKETDYVPIFLNEDGDEESKYICLTIDENGRIANWNDRSAIDYTKSHIDRFIEVYSKDEV
jgi:hypothetical protein